TLRFRAKGPRRCAGKWAGPRLHSTRPYRASGPAGPAFGERMSNREPRPVPATIDETLALLTGADYGADRALATVLFLSLRMQRPLFLEGEAGVGKTEIAKVLAN